MAKANSKKPRIKNVPSSMGIQESERIKNYYEGASQGTRMRDKGMRVSGPNAEIERSLPALQKRSRHAIANHPYGCTGRNAYVDNLVGNGIKAKWENKELQRLWDIWELECDADGISNFPGQQALVAGTEFSDGETLIRRRWRRPDDGLTVPFQIEVLESDMLPISLTDTAKGIRLAIQKNGIGQRTYYHLYNHHPSDLPSDFGMNQTRAVPANDLIHYFQRIRPKQDRGIPHLSVVLVRLYEIDEMQDATLVKQKTAQLFAWIIKKQQQEFGDDDPSDVDDASNIDYDEIQNGEERKLSLVQYIT